MRRPLGPGAKAICNPAWRIDFRDALLRRIGARRGDIRGRDKQLCILCGQLIDRDARFCPAGQPESIGYCVSDLNEAIVKDTSHLCRCAANLRPLPHCGQPTFVQDRCERCDQTLMVACSNRRCGVWQFFQNATCTACGKKIKNKIEQKRS
jgi:hypothetical protein